MTTISEFMVRETAQVHALVFAEEIAALGLDVFDMEEPYLQEEIWRFQLQFITSMDRLFGQSEAYLSDTKEWAVFDDCQEWKALNDIEPLATQMQERIAIETQRLSGRVHQRLDALRQQAVGIERYVWRTQDDGRVRVSHAANDDQVFRWDVPPPTGHPGDAFGCRCRAEPLYREGDFLSPQPFEVAGRGKIIADLIRKILQKSSGMKERLDKYKIPIGKKPPKGGRQDIEWRLGDHKSKKKWENQKQQRGWTDKQITEAIKDGKAFPETNRMTDGEATRYVHPETGRSVVRDNVTKEILQVGDDGFKF